MHTANVRSIDALKDFRNQLIAFRDSGSQVLAAVQVEIRRTLDWLSHDQAKYWQQEIRHREERVNEAKMELSRAMMSKNASGEPPPCTEQKVALAKAKQRLAEAEDKLDRVKHWVQVLQQEVEDFRGPSQTLASRLDAGLPKAVVWLDQAIASLEAYVGMAPVEEAAPVEAASQPAPVYPTLTPPSTPGSGQAATAQVAATAAAVSSTATNDVSQPQGSRGT
jgi:exonuclease VII large subunit